MRSDNDMKNYWGEYSKFGQHKQVTKNVTLNQNEIITIKTSLIDQLLSGSDYKLHRTSCLSSNTKISDVPMMGNRVKGAGTGNGEKGASHGERENEQREQNRELEMKILIARSWFPTVVLRERKLSFDHETNPSSLVWVQNGNWDLPTFG